jgi:uracil-DNA glycosylase family 4
MVVGEAPGADEVREGKPFIGYSGQLLRDVMRSVGIDPDAVYYANLCKYRPPNNELRSFFDDKGVPNAQVLEGLTELKTEIEEVNPNVIIPVGNYPLKFITGRGTWSNGYSGIGTYRGSILQGTAFAGGRKCIPTYHPAAATRQYSLKHIMRVDLSRAKDQAAYAAIQRPRKFILLDPQGDDREAWSRWLVAPTGTESPRFRFSDTDLEWTTVKAGSFLTGDIEYIGSRLLCCGLTRHADVAVVFATRDAAAISHIRAILGSGVPLCFQNGMFDCSILEYFYNIPCIQYLMHDTMIAMHAAYTEFPKDLGFIGSIFTEQPVWFEQPDPKNPGRYVLVNAEFWKAVKRALEGLGLGIEYYEKFYFPYNGTDVWVTHASMESMLADELTDPAIYNTYRHEMSLVRPLWEIGKRGVKIDIGSLQDLSKTLEQEASILLAGIAQYAGGKAVNVKSPPQVAEFLYGAMGVPQIGPKTPKGRWKMDDDTLASLLLKSSNEKQKTAIKMVRDCRERLDLISKFCEIELDDDGRMRCHYDPAKTDTGRLSSRKFYPTGRGTNLQNVPRDPRVRAVFVPDKGYIFAYADLKSAESLVVAHITGDPEMLRLHSPEYLSGSLDGHKYVASFLLDKAIDQITKDERYLGKRVRHAGNYGLGWFRLMQLINADAQKTGVTVDAAQAKRLIEKYRQLHPMLKYWWDRVLSQLWETHTLTTQHGRKRTFYGRPDEILPEAIAYNPQGTVAQTLNMGLLRIAPDYLKEPNNYWMAAYDWDRSPLLHADVVNKCYQVQHADLQMLLQVHDAVGFQVPEANADKVLPLVKELMAIPIPIQRRGEEPYEITIPVDIQVGYNWGEFDPKKPDLNPNGLRQWNG